MLKTATRGRAIVMAAWSRQWYGVWSRGAEAVATSKGMLLTSGGADVHQVENPGG